MTASVGSLISSEVLGKLSQQFTLPRTAACKRLPWEIETRLPVYHLIQLVHCSSVPYSH